VQDKTKQLWAIQRDQHPGGRLHLFSAVADALDVSTALYPGSYVDIEPSFVFDDVTYVDADRRVPKFFADSSGVDEIIAANRTMTGRAEWHFIHADYTTDLDLPDEGFDLLVSLRRVHLRTLHTASQAWRVPTRQPESWRRCQGIDRHTL
jgi:hypothetical protein